MNITMTLEGDSTERLVQTVCAVIGGAQAGAAAPAQPAVPAPEKARAYKAPEPEAAPKKEPKREPEPHWSHLTGRKSRCRRRAGNSGVLRVIAPAVRPALPPRRCPPGVRPV